MTGKDFMPDNANLLDQTYQIIEEIGAGGSGVIYKAYHTRLRKVVVIKKIKDNFVGVINGRSEVDILKNLRHTGLPQVYDFVQLGSQVYTVMEYIEGYDLKRYLSAGTVFEEKTLRAWLDQLLDMLEYLHGQNPVILHNDIKPANIMVTESGSLYLIDFNISLDGSESDTIRGLTKEYASPEQRRKMEARRNNLPDGAIKLDARSDIYSLGKTFQRLMERGDFSPELWEIVNKAADENPIRRFQSAKSMRKALAKLEREDSDFLHGRNRLFAVSVAIGLTAVAVIAAVTYADNLKVKDNVKKTINTLESASDNYDGDTLINVGTDALNDQRLTGEINREAGTRAWILHAVGDGYFWKEDFDTASGYYDEAAVWAEKNSDSNLPLYDRDRAIAYAKAGDLETAKECLEDAKAEGVSDAELDLIQGQILAKTGEISEAEKLLTEAAGRTSDSETRRLLYQELGGIYEENGNAGQAIDCYESALKLGETKRILRKLGELYNVSRNTAKALSCYEKLYGMDAPSYEDSVNYALSLELVKRYGEAETVLETAASDKNDYKAWLYLSRIEYERAKTDKNPDFGKAVRYYDKAKEYYASAKVEGKNDSLMDEMGEALKESE